MEVRLKVHLSLLALALGAFAPLATRADNRKIQVQLLDDGSAAPELDSARYEVRPLPRRGPSQLPERPARDARFEESGLSAQLESWDELDRDLLYVTARDAPEKRLLRKYPKLAPAKLRQLQAAIRAHDGKAGE